MSNCHMPAELHVGLGSLYPDTITKAKSRGILCEGPRHKLYTIRTSSKSQKDYKKYVPKKRSTSKRADKKDKELRDWLNGNTGSRQRSPSKHSASKHSASKHSPSKHSASKHSASKHSAARNAAFDELKAVDGLGNTYDFQDNKQGLVRALIVPTRRSARIAAKKK